MLLLLSVFEPTDSDHWLNVNCVRNVHGIGYSAFMMKLARHSAMCGLGAAVESDFLL